MAFSLLISLLHAYVGFCKPLLDARSQFSFPFVFILKNATKVGTNVALLLESV